MKLIERKIEAGKVVEREKEGNKTIREYGIKREKGSEKRIKWFEFLHIFLILDN